MSMKKLDLFAAAADIDIELDGCDRRKTAPLTKDRKGARAFIFTNGEDVCGAIIVNTKSGKKVDHNGIKVEMIGQIENLKDEKCTYDFFCVSKDIEPAGIIASKKSFQFRFGSVEMPDETYCGTNMRLRYFTRVTIQKKRGEPIKHELDILVQNSSPAPSLTDSLKMEVGIDECLHIEFEYDKSAYHMKDVVVGKVYFLLVRIKIKRMELVIVRRETMNPIGKMQAITENDTISTFEIMDGAPVKDECIPVRHYMTGIDLSPSFNNVQNRFSVKYFLNLVLIDEEDRRYFKQQEVKFYRK